MLGLFCATRSKPSLFTSLSFTLNSPAHHHRFIHRPIKLFTDSDQHRQRHHSNACHRISGAASIWHAILPAGGERGRRPGEGSWNVAWDVRPARWLHRPDFAWLLFGVCASLAAPPPLDFADVDNNMDRKDGLVVCDEKYNSLNYRITGVPADGRCLFRAIAHVACLRNGEDAPDENHQRELADDLRAQVVDELLKRRKETEWFIEGDFDSYVERIQQPYVWGGEPELLMASHVLKTPISVYMLDRSSSSLIKIADYGEGYSKEEENPIKVLFHGYGHYDILEAAVSDQNYRKEDNAKKSGEQLEPLD